MSECQVHTRFTTLMVQLRVSFRMEEDVVCLASLCALFINGAHMGSLNCSGNNQSNFNFLQFTFSLMLLVVCVCVCVGQFVCVCVSTGVFWPEYSGLIQKRHTVTKGIWFNSILKNLYFILYYTLYLHMFRFI